MDSLRKTGQAWKKLRVENNQLKCYNKISTEHIKELRKAIEDLMVEYEIPCSDYLKQLLS
jgi:hypothetical protein